MRSPIIIDTNVLLVANGGPAYSKSCAFECAQKLLLIQRSGTVVLDAGREILKEYANKQPRTGQPGIGFLFWKWLLNSVHCSMYCELIPITKLEPHGYAEFPDHQDLHLFDSSDRKFVAVAIAHSAKPPILQATDSKWWGWNAALLECGVTVKFLCIEEIAAKYQRKMGHSQS